MTKQVLKVKGITLLSSLALLLRHPRFLTSLGALRDYFPIHPDERRGKRETSVSRPLPCAVHSFYPILTKSHG